MYAICLLYFRFIFLYKVLIVDISCILPYIWLAPSLASFCTAGSSKKVIQTLCPLYKNFDDLISHRFMAVFPYLFIYFDKSPY